MKTVFLSKRYWIKLISQVKTSTKNCFQVDFTKRTRRQRLICHDYSQCLYWATKREVTRGCFFGNI